MTVEDKISVVVPVYNEEMIYDTLSEVYSFLAGKHDFEIVIVDDSDNDCTGEIKKLIAEKDAGRIRLVRGDQQGKGGAVKKGINAAAGDIVFILDADIRIPLANMEGFVRLITEKGYDIVIAERPLSRNLSNPARFFFSFSLLVLVRCFVFGSCFFYDTQCGFKAFKKAVARELARKQTINGGMYDIEHLYIARQASLKIAKVRINPLEEIRKSKINLLKCLVKDPLDLARIKLNGWSGKYRR